MRRSQRRRRPVVPAGFVEAVELRRLGGTAVRFLARGLSLPDLLDESFERCHGDGIFHRLGGWLLGRNGLFGQNGRPLRGAAGAKAACPGE